MALMQCPSVLYAPIIMGLFCTLNAILQLSQSIWWVGMVESGLIRTVRWCNGAASKFDSFLDLDLYSIFLYYFGNFFFRVRFSNHNFLCDWVFSLTAEPRTSVLA